MAKAQTDSTAGAGAKGSVPPVEDAPSSERDAGGVSEGPSSERAAPYGLIHLGIALFAVLLVGVLTAVDYLPTEQGPRALLMAWWSNHYDDPGTHYRAFLQVGTPATSLGFQLLFGGLERLLPWRAALRVALALIGLWFGAGFYQLVVRLAPERKLVGLLGFALAPCWPLYLGLWSFTLATALGLSVLALALAGWPWSSDRRFAIAMLLAVVGVTELLPAQLLAVVLACVVVARAAPGRRLVELGWLACMALPLVGIALASGAMQEGSQGLVAPAAPLAMSAPVLAKPALGDRLHIALRCFAAGPWWRGGAVCVLAVLGLVSAWAKERSAAERGLAAGAAALLLGAVALPLRAQGGQLLAPLLLPLGVMPALALLPIERLRGGRGLAAGAALVAFGLASLGWAGWYGVTLRARSESFLAGLQAPLSPKGPRLAISLDPYAGGPPQWQQQQVPFSAPARRLDMLYAVAQGGIPPHLSWAQRGPQPLALSLIGQKRYPAAPTPAGVAAALDGSQPAAQGPAQPNTQGGAEGDAQVRAAFMGWAAFVGSAFEDVIVYGHANDFVPLKQAGYRPDFESERLFIGAFEGCRATLQVLGPAERIRFAQGWSGIQQSARERVVRPRGKPPHTIRVSGLPCGAAWLQPAIERAGQLHRCAEANRAGAFDLTLARTQPTLVRCTPE